MVTKLEQLKEWAKQNVTLIDLLPNNNGLQVTTRLIDVLEDEVDEKYYLSIAQTLQAGEVNQGVVMPKEEYGRFGKQAIETLNDNKDVINDGMTVNAYNKTLDDSGLSPTLTTRPEGFKTAILPITNGLRIRKLTPLECWRLQGFTDEQFYKAKNDGVSNSQLYKQAGNSVSVPVVDSIVKCL